MDEINLLETVPPTGKEQVQQSEEITPESDPGTPIENVDAPQESPKPKTDWAQKRIDKLTWEKREGQRVNDALKTQLSQYQSTAQIADPATPESMQQAVHQQAQQLVAQEKFNDACNRVFKAGVAESPEFERNLKTLQSVGEIKSEFLEAITDMENGHRVLNHLGSNPELADSILAMPPLKQVMALARLESSLGKSAPAPVSQFPAPINPVGSRASPVAPESFSTTADYIAWHKKTHK